MSTIKLTDSIPIEKPTLSNFCDIFTDWHDKYLLLLFEISLEVTLALGRRSRKIQYFDLSLVITRFITCLSTR